MPYTMLLSWKAWYIFMLPARCDSPLDALLTVVIGALAAVDLVGVLAFICTTGHEQ